MAILGMLNSGSRGNIITIMTILCLLTLIISFRTVITEHAPWRSPVASPPTFGSGHSQQDSPIPAKQPAPPSKQKPSMIQAPPKVKPTAAKAAPAATSSVVAGCEGFPNTDDILVVMKTGATEAYDKLPIHFMTTIRCVNDTILFSDMEMNVAGHKLIDVLADIPQQRMQDNPDFDLYRKLQVYKALHEDPRDLKAGGNGWTLDKYKFLPMLLKTWKYRQDASWYLFVEADTGIIWDNMRTLLDKFDPKQKFYIGSPTYLDIEFAHGGTGYAISNAAMKAAVGNHPDIDEKYAQKTKEQCCGDAQISRVLLDEDVHLTKVWPMFNGEKPLTLPFQKSHWCQPVVTMHHLTAQEVSQVWNFEQQRKKNGIKEPMVWRDVYNYFVKAAMTQSRRDDWTNLSDDIAYESAAGQPDREFGNGRKWKDLSPIEQSSPESPENCEKACDILPACMMWMHQGHVCRIHKSFKLGMSHPAENNQRFISGWKLDRIAAFVESEGDCEGKVDWGYRKAG